MNNQQGDELGVTQRNSMVAFIGRHQLAMLITLTILIAFVTTAIGLMLYNTSGTAQVDLSRPGYEGVSKELQGDEDHKYIEYPASGPINEETLDEFERYYQMQLDNITSVDAFSGDPLDPSSLGIEDKDTSEQQ